MVALHGTLTPNEISTKLQWYNTELLDLSSMITLGYSHITPMIDQLGWDSLEQRRLLSRATMFYKIQQGLVGTVSSFPLKYAP